MRGGDGVRAREGRKKVCYKVRREVCREREGINITTEDFTEGGCGLKEKAESLHYGKKRAGKDREAEK